MKMLGLTGGMGTGKTTVCGMFKRLGAVVFSSDSMVHEELKKNKELKEKIIGAFGSDILSRGSIDRKLLAKKVFNNPRNLSRLNDMIHPIVKRNILAHKSQVAKKYKNVLCVIEVPLLFETGFDKLFDATAVVAAVPAIQEERILKKKKLSLLDLKLRMRFQWPLDKKISACDFVIDNNETKVKTFKQVKKVMEVLLWKSLK